jgi:hypothetical protein
MINAMDTRLRVPTIAEVEHASLEQLAWWFRFLPAIGQTEGERKAYDRIGERFKKLGGMTEKLSKKIGH